MKIVFQQSVRTFIQTITKFDLGVYPDLCENSLDYHKSTAESVRRVSTCHQSALIEHEGSTGIDPQSANAEYGDLLSAAPDPIEIREAVGEGFSHILLLSQNNNINKLTSYI